MVSTDSNIYFCLSPFGGAAHELLYKRTSLHTKGNMLGKSILDLCLEYPQMSAQVFHFVNSCSQAENVTGTAIIGQTYRYFISWIKREWTGQKNTRKILTAKPNSGRQLLKISWYFLTEDLLQRVSINTMSSSAMDQPTCSTSESKLSSITLA